MINQYLCSTFNSDYEEYLKQLLLFSDNVEVMYPLFHFPRPIDQEFVNQTIRTLSKYKGFDNVTLNAIEVDPERIIPFSKYPKFYKYICKRFELSSVEQQCLLQYENQEFAYECFMHDHPIHFYCGYMRKIYNIAMECYNFVKPICDTYSLNGNLISNSGLLNDLLSSDIFYEEANNLQAQGLSNWYEVIDSREFVSTNCENCKKASGKPFGDFSNLYAKQKAIEVILPDYSELEIDDIYEIRLKAKSEIEQLSAYLNELSAEISSEEQLNRIISQKIQPSINDFNNKVKCLNLTGLQKILSLRNIATVPLFITLLSNMPGYISVGLSTVFMATDIAIEMRKENLKIQSEPLYFSLKLNNTIKKQIKHTKRP